MKLEDCSVCGDKPAGSPEPLVDKYFEETCARDGRRNFIISPKRRIEINFEQLRMILSERGLRIKSSGIFGITFEQSDDVITSILKGGIMVAHASPKHGYGSGINPCLDCRIMKIRKAGEYMREIGATFLFTGEVLGQRPMSQHRKAIEIIDRESGFQGYILRPLSAAHFRPTVPEREGWINRSKLLGISGRSRKKQISLAAEKGIQDYPCPAGGCLLTDKHFSDKMHDYFRFTERPSIKDMPLLNVGRHLRLKSGDKIIVARNESECKMLKKLYRENDHLLVSRDFSGPVVILQGSSIEAAVERMLLYTKKPVDPTDRIMYSYGGKTHIVSLDEIWCKSTHAWEMNRREYNAMAWGHEDTVKRREKIIGMRCGKPEN